LASDSDHITVNLIGGLGNQLFQYSAGKFLANKLGIGLKLNLNQIGTGGTFRKPDILQMNLQGISIVGDGRPWLSAKYLHLPKRAYFKVQRFLTSQEKYIESHQIFRPKTDGFDPRILKISNPIVLQGYFQTYKYADFLRNEFSQLCELNNASSWFLDRSAEIAYTNPIALHIRRGDYGPLARSFGLLSSEYYLNALRELPESLINKEVWVFSDDVDGAKKVLKGINRKFTFVEVNSDSNPAENLILMSKCAANIIANSTFSWWGAYLNFCSITTVAPTNWFRDMSEPNDILPPNWTAIPSHWED